MLHDTYVRSSKLFVSLPEVPRLSFIMWDVIMIMRYNKNPRVDNEDENSPGRVPGKYTRNR